MWILGWIFLSVLVGSFASLKKRSGVGWFFLSLIISPLIGFLILLVAGQPADTLKKCPRCAEEVKAEALICRYCNYEFPHEKEKLLTLKSADNFLGRTHEKVQNLMGSNINELTSKKRWF